MDKEKTLSARLAWRDAVWNSDLPTTRKIVALAYEKYAGKGLNDVWVYEEVLSEITGVAISTCGRAKADLQQLGWMVEISPRSNNRCAHYALRIPAGSQSTGHSDGYEDPVPVTVTGDTGHGDGYVPVTVTTSTGHSDLLIAKRNSEAEKRSSVSDADAPDAAAAASSTTTQATSPPVDNLTAGLDEPAVKPGDSEQAPSWSAMSPEQKDDFKAYLNKARPKNNPIRNIEAVVRRMPADELTKHLNVFHASKQKPKSWYDELVTVAEWQPDDTTLHLKESSGLTDDEFNELVNEYKQLHQHSNVKSPPRNIGTEFDLILRDRAEQNGHYLFTSRRTNPRIDQWIN